MKQLWAKSTDTPDAVKGAELLVGHTQLVRQAAKTLLETVGAESLRAVGLPESLLSRLTRIVALAAFIHDLGKCSDQFQRMVRGEQLLQMFRHEALSLWLVWPRKNNALGAWLLEAAGADLDLKMAAIAGAGHHRKFPARAMQEEGAGNALLLHIGHADFRALLKSFGDDNALPPPPLLSDITVTPSEGRRLKIDFPMSWAELELSVDDKRLLAVAKALVICADVAGSALPKSEVGFGWLATALKLETDGGTKRLVEKRLGTKSLRPFQAAVGTSSAPVTFVRAGCGSGKTLAAWHWAATQHPGRQLWMCYPTTGTTTEGFRDYVQGAELDGFIEHGRVAVDLDLFGLREGSDNGDVIRDADRLRALRLWGADAITCTVDTVLGLLQNQRKGLYAWPGLVRSAVVFDEIHSYDDELFSLLLAWLEQMRGIPALLMTASLPASRLEALRKVVQTTHGQPLSEIAGPPELEQLKRYVQSKESPGEAATHVLGDGGKVLWVCNTVAQCMAVRTKGPWAENALLYHSRFRYRDRVARHGAVVDAFRGAGGVLAVTSQVAEMSLDLSADLLVTELAPIPSMIQRLGRLNRRSSPDNPVPPKPFIVIEPEQALPYDKAELARTRQWLASLGTKPLSQADLAAAWVDDSGVPPKPAGGAWLGDGYTTEPHSVREASIGVTVLLETDVAAIRAGAQVAEFALPMGAPPKRLNFASWRREKFHPVAPAASISYDEELGASWL